MAIWPISTRVNSPKNDDADLLKPLAPGTSPFRGAAPLVQEQDELYTRVLSSSGPRFSAPGRCSLSCPSAARPWLAVQRRRRRAATVQIPQYPARHASSCSSHPRSGRERGPAGRQIAGAADERCSLDCCACVQISAPARRRLFRPAVSRPALAAPTQLSGLVEKPRSLLGPAERACRRRADHDSAPRKEPDGPSSVVASLPLTGAANCSFAEPAPARVNEALAEPTNATSPGITIGQQYRLLHS